MKDLLRELWHDAHSDDVDCRGIWNSISSNEPQFSYAAFVVNVSDHIDGGNAGNGRSRIVRSFREDSIGHIYEIERVEYCHAFVVRAYMDDPVKLTVTGSDLRENVVFLANPVERPHSFLADATNDLRSQVRDGDATYFGCFIKVDRDSVIGAQSMELSGKFRLRLIEGGPQPQSAGITLDNGPYHISLERV